MRSKLLLAMLLLASFTTASNAGADDREFARSPVGYDPYVGSYLDGYRYVPWPIDVPYTHGARHRVPVYMYGYFGARKRHEPKIHQGYNEYIRGVRRGYNW